MSEEIKKKIINYMESHNICTIATIREDGFPQANTVEYVNDGLNIIFVTNPKSQKIKNIKFNNKISLTIDEDYPDWNKIKGVSIGGFAEILESKEEIDKAMGLYLKKFPFVADFPRMEMAFVRIIPKIVYYLDYEVGWGYHEVLEL